MDNVIKLKNAIRRLFKRPYIWSNAAELCAVAYEIKFISNDKGEYFAARIRMTDDPPLVWIDTCDGVIKAINGQQIYTEPFIDAIGIDNCLREMWLSRLDDKDRDRLGVTSNTEPYRHVLSY